MNLRTIAVAAALTACSPLTVFAQALRGGAMSTPPLLVTVVVLPTKLTITAHTHKNRPVHAKSRMRSRTNYWQTALAYIGIGAVFSATKRSLRPSAQAL
jgi:hypothetical protein